MSPSSTNLWFLTPGSQGVRGTTLSRLAEGDHPDMDLEPLDTAIFRSRTIPGNELAPGMPAIIREIAWSSPILSGD
ncbi:hypothetical protein [Halioglobus japonicus]|uniref:hypothetical protein n=1 Tax=Halioglobus japonicus TaxID=930805 RepID=UPI0035712E78